MQVTCKSAMAAPSRDPNNAREEATPDYRVINVFQPNGNSSLLNGRVLSTTTKQGLTENPDFALKDPG